LKKRNEWVRKALKRKKKEKDRGIVDFMMIIYHFFEQLPQWINEMTDPRHVSYIQYQQADLTMLGILKNICSIESMRQMEEKLNEEICIDTLRILSGNRELSEMPHYDTLNNYLERLSPECLSGLRKKMVVSLIRSKQFYKHRLLGKYWKVILDGTSLFYFKERHCENCLSTTHKSEDGKIQKRYYHKVLEAKLVLSDEIVISIGTEFIENECEDVCKQDCEINAAKRLLSRLKKEYPKLRLCVQGDALYAAESIMGICQKNGWEYILTQKETRQKVLADNYERLGEEKAFVENMGKEGGVGAYANGVGRYAGKRETMNVYEYRYTKREEGEERNIRFQWITSIQVTKRNLEEMIHTGRGRWKIENEGFNNQKNILYQIEHLNSRNGNAMKNHYMLTQVADILMQLYLAWNPLVKEINQSIKNTSSRLLESFRRHTVTDEDVFYIQRYTTVYLE
jgi:Transposase DDE domain